MSAPLLLIAMPAMFVIALPVQGAKDSSSKSGPAANQVRLLASATDDSAGGLDCYRIETPSAVYYLDKVGAGLSSMIDRDGNDWIGFHSRSGSGAAGEYRGFPNAVFREAGSYFHPRNAGTDPCLTKVEQVTAERIVISATSSNKLWAGQYTFTTHACTFTLTKKPANHRYWILYEGTPGGQYDESDWWMTSASPKKTPLKTNHEGDIKKTEWIAFGDHRLDRVLFLSHHEDDSFPDRFYPMQKKMTVFGFGREGMKKFLDTVPQSFSIGFVESTKHDEIRRHVERLMKASAISKGGLDKIPQSVPAEVRPPALRSESVPPGSRRSRTPVVRTSQPTTPTVSSGSVP